MTTQVLQHSSSSSSSVSSSLSCDVSLHHQQRRNIEREDRQDHQDHQLSILSIFVTVFKRSIMVGGCTSSSDENCSLMEIGSPRDVRHVAHVTFDKFNGFLGLPDDFEPHLPRQPPSASAKVFGVSTESMQLSFDSRGNSVPTILILMQNRLYEQGGLQAEGIFRINPDNSQEEYVREELNKGVIPDGVDVHSLAGLVKAWFRELPKGILDSLPPEKVIESQSEEECSQLVTLLPSTEAALLDWAINLMADVAQMENHNKMNARNIAMVFAPNMSQMTDPLTALMYAVQVMNFLKTLIIKTIREREECVVVDPPCLDRSNHVEYDHGNFLQQFIKNSENNEEESVFAADYTTAESEWPSYLTSFENTNNGLNNSTRTATVKSRHSRSGRIGVWG